jgi:hypothetical protein
MAKRLALPRKITLRMQQSDIDTAICNSRTNCAIARTIYRQMQMPPGRVRVSMEGVSIGGKDDYRYHYKTPHEACCLVRDIDDGKSVKPITFSLRFCHRHKIAPVDPDRKANINAARQAREQALRDAGLEPRKYPKGRYGI